MTPLDDPLALARRVDALEDAFRAHEQEGTRAAKEAEYRRSFRHTILLAFLVPLGVWSLFIGGYLLGRYGHP